MWEDGGGDTASYPMRLRVRSPTVREGDSRRVVAADLRGVAANLKKIPILNLFLSQSIWS